jgi:hypothetical protein
VKAIDEEVWIHLSFGEQKVPRAYRDFLIMREMNWSWCELMTTPWEVVEDCWRYIQTEAKYRQHKMDEARE